MKEMMEGNEKESGKRKGERNEGAIDDTSLDLRQSDDQNWSEKEAKFIYEMRFLCRYQYPEFSSKSKR